MTARPIHPGVHIRASILPEGLAVKKAAELMGVGRPALSNLLNGNAALTSEMATRLEKTFGANAQELLALQASYDEFQRIHQGKEIAVKAYVKTFLGIEARQIAAWSEQTQARSELPAFLRRLVHTTGSNLEKVDFPAFDNAQRPGWDGYVTTDTATPWIPRGNSGWELGCNQDPVQKAEGDYQSRTTSIGVDERKEITFVFVTPKNWAGKEKWAKAKKGKHEWKDVRVYDASDLEQWLEQSIATQVWFAEKLGHGATGTLTLEQCWKQWAEVTSPPLSKALFHASVEMHKKRIYDWLSNPPSEPFLITADSEIEALAFTNCILESLGTSPGQFFDRTIVLQTVESLKRAVASSPGFIAIVCSQDVELASAGLQKTHHMLIIRRRNNVSGEPDIALDLIDHQTFREALTEMTFSHQDCEHYARETGHSATILRRRLSRIPAIHAPAWATDRALARKLIPLNFVGVWNSDKIADQDIMRLLTSAEYADVERSAIELQAVADAPIWSVGKFRGVMSKIDVLFAVKDLVTKADLDNFFFVAQYVLSETDPALDLPPDKQWAAGLYGKTRDHSSPLRQGLCETLVLLAVHGNNLFSERLGINIESTVNATVKALLTPADTRTWASQRGDLPRYAEAAPDVFLEILEQDLASNQPKIHELLRPTENMPFGGCPRSGLLWALETLAWKPERLTRVSSLLARLSTVQISDNWSNKPEASLQAIYRAWMPQTAASIEQRNNALETLCGCFPEIGWRLCLEQFSAHSRIGHYSARPHWRNDASGAGEPVKTKGEAYRVANKALRLALSWPHHNETTLGDLVENLRGIAPAEQEEVWSLIKAWINTAPNDNSKQKLRECIRKYAFTRHARIRGIDNSSKNRAREIYDLLNSEDLILRHLWLFAQNWIDESADEMEDDDLDYQKREARITEARRSALQEIWSSTGYDGITRLSQLGNADGIIGWLLAEGIIENTNIAPFIDWLTGQTEPSVEHKIDNMLGSFLRALKPSQRKMMIADYIHCTLPVSTANEDKIIRVLKCAPFRRETWQQVASLPEELQKRYWRETYIRWEQQDEEELGTLVDKLMEAQRPHAALEVIHLDFEKIEALRLVNLLRQLATSTIEPTERFRFSRHEVSEAFKSLKSRSTVLPEVLAQLEFMYVEVLHHSDYGIPTLAQEIAKEPLSFMQLIAFLYRRNDGNEDPAEWVLPEERRQAVASAAHHVLDSASWIPGTKHDGTIDAIALRQWIEKVRDLGRLYGRPEVTDLSIGDLLAKCPSDEGGLWPCEAVRHVLDATASQDIARGMATGRYNLRGAHWGGGGGQEERELAAQYRGWSKAVAFQWPFTAKLLEELAHTYDHEATWHTTEANINKRLPY